MRNYFEFYNPAKINCGKDALHTLGPELEYFGASHPMIIASANAERMGALEKVLKALVGTNVAVGSVYVMAAQKPEREPLHELKEKYEAEGCDGIVAVGGECAMDSAKALKLFLSEECDDFLPLAGTTRRPVKDVPLVVIPTENGSGHEASGFIEMEDNFISTPGIVPNAVIIDSAVAEIAPARVIAACGVYALANAIEAYLNADDITVTEIYAQKAIKLIFEHLKKVVNDEETEEDSLGVALASTLAGIAFGNVPYGAAHALATAISEKTDETKEEMIALSLVPMLKSLTDEQREKLKYLLPYTCSFGEVSETPKSERASRTIENVEKLVNELHEIANIPLKLSETSVPRELFGQIAECAQNKRSALIHLRAVGKDDFLKLLNACY